jgi:7-keto-8-aminopelargonate synthetase-like enzyme
MAETICGPVRPAGAVMQVTARLLESRVFVQGIRPPTVPVGTARLRVALSAGHSTSDVESLAGALRHFT